MIPCVAPIAILVSCAVATEDPASSAKWQALWIQGTWEWKSADGNGRLLQTFGADGKWTLDVNGTTSDLPRSGSWKLWGYSERPPTCIVLFSDVPGLEHGFVCQYEFEFMDTLQPLILTDQRKYRRVKDVR